MSEKIFEIRIVDTSKISSEAREEVTKQVMKEPEKFKDFRGFAKITYVTASPPRIKSIEPINGSINEYFKKEMTPPTGMDEFIVF
ncbi:hypothetical protein J4401_00005 [Candidatus Woesearchaeota archaeon]|nr:hypothetical protein [Candidatus Woesearchaeota archaeon]